MDGGEKNWMDGRKWGNGECELEEEWKWESRERRRMMRMEMKEREENEGDERMGVRKEEGKGPGKVRGMPMEY